MPGRGPARSRHVLGSSVPASSLVQLRSPQRAAVGGEAGLTLACLDVGWSEDWGADGQMSLGLLCPLPRRREEQPGSLQGALSRSSSRSMRPSPPTCGPSVSHAFRRTPLEGQEPTGRTRNLCKLRFLGRMGEADVELINFAFSSARRAHPFPKSDDATLSTKGLGSSRAKPAVPRRL